MLKKSRNIIHVEIKSCGVHCYYGSVAAMFDDREIAELIGIAYSTFRKKILKSGFPFEDEKVIIRKGNLKTIQHKH